MWFYLWVVVEQINDRSPKAREQFVNLNPFHIPKNDEKRNDSNYFHGGGRFNDRNRR